MDLKDFISKTIKQILDGILSAVDNSSARQINDSVAILANSDLRRLRDIDLLITKDKNRYTYYLPTNKLKSSYLQEVDALGSNHNSPSALPTNLSALLQMSSNRL